MSETVTKLSFNDVVGKICRSWDVLQHAVEGNFGGIHSKEKAEWLETVIVQFFNDNEYLEPFEVENYISDIMDNEFDLLVEDNSLPILAKNLCQCYAWLKNDDENRLKEFLSRLNIVKKSIPPMRIQPENNNNEEETSDEQDNSEPMQVDEKISSDTPIFQNSHDLQPKRDVKTPEKNELDDGWTIVSHKKKK